MQEIPGEADANTQKHLQCTCLNSSHNLGQTCRPVSHDRTQLELGSFICLARPVKKSATLASVCLTLTRNRKTLGGCSEKRCNYSQKHLL